MGLLEQFIFVGGITPKTLFVYIIVSAIIVLIVFPNKLYNLINLGWIESVICFLTFGCPTL